MLPRYRRVWARLKDLLMRLRNWLRGQGFSGMASLFDRFAPQTAEELYERCSDEGCDQDRISAAPERLVFATPRSER
jgi:hypothetical protein